MEGVIMDSERFDGLVRTFSQIRSRRQTLRGLAGAVAVGALALGAQEVGADTCKGTGKPCKKNRQCCSNNCVGASGGTANDGTCQPQYFQGTCEVGENYCQTGSFENCTPDPNCLCVTTATTGTACVDASDVACVPGGCRTDDECATFGDDYVCVAAATFCGCLAGTTVTNICVRQCNAGSASVARTRRTGRNPLRLRR
jgi:hypothetical protein